MNSYITKCICFDTFIWNRKLNRTKLKKKAKIELNFINNRVDHISPKPKKLNPNRELYWYFNF